MRFTFQKVAATSLLASLRTHQIHANEVPIGSPYFKKVTDILYNDNFSHGMFLASSDNSSVVAISGVLYDSTLMLTLIALVSLCIEIIMMERGRLEGHGILP